MPVRNRRIENDPIQRALNGWDVIHINGFAGDVSFGVYVFHFLFTTEGAEITEKKSFKIRLFKAFIAIPLVEFDQEIISGNAHRKAVLEAIACNQLYLSHH